MTLAFSAIVIGIDRHLSDGEVVLGINHQALSRYYTHHGNRRQWKEREGNRREHKAMEGKGGQWKGIEGNRGGRMDLLSDDAIDFQSNCPSGLRAEPLSACWHLFHCFGCI